MLQTPLTYIQARMGSTRLPGKTMKPILGKPLLGLLVERVRRSQFASKFIIATTVSAEDDVIADWCLRNGFPLFRGSEEDVLGRFYEASMQFPGDPIIRITADCPLIDPVVIDRVVKFYIEGQASYDYVSNTIERCFPRGMDVEVFSLKCLHQAAHEARLPGEREHVTPFIYTHPERYRIGQLLDKRNASQYRLCVDTAEDYVLVSKIFEALYPKNPYFTLEDVLDLLHIHPDWNAINKDVEQKKWDA